MMITIIRFKRYLLLFAFVVINAMAIHAQDKEVKVRSGFFADSIGIGERVKYYLTATYPSNLNVLFPDSAFHFTPFEFASKQYFTTNTVNGVSYDSVIYTITTFEVDKIQALSLPVYAVTLDDSVEFTSDTDSIMLAELVGPIADSIAADRLPLKANTTYTEVSHGLNYIVLGIIGVSLVVVALIVFLVFGKRIRKYYLIKRLNRYHNAFLDSYKVQVDQIKSSFSVPVSETAIGLWKKYMEQLVSRPYTKLTTKEMLRLEQDENLAANLHAIDKAIYGHDTDVIESFEQLRAYAANKFVKRLEELKHD